MTNQPGSNTPPVDEDDPFIDAVEVTPKKIDLQKNPSKKDAAVAPPETPKVSSRDAPGG